MPTYAFQKTILLFVVGLIFTAGSTGRAADSSVKDSIGLLKSPDIAIRLKAIDQLASAGEKAIDAAPELILLLEDPDQSVRRHAVAALIAVNPDPKVMLPLFKKLMHDSDPGVHARILNAITEAGPIAVPGLINALDDDKAAFWACIVLRGIGPKAKAAVPALMKKLNDSDPDIRREVVLALGAMGQAAMPALPKIAASLDDEFVRGAATFVLGELGNIPPDVEKKIRDNATSENKSLSTVSLWALAKVHPENKTLRREVTETFVERLKDADPVVRVVAARALAALPPEPQITIPIFENAFKDADATTVRHALDALATLGAPAVPNLISILEKHKELRPEIACVLGQMGPVAAPATDALAKLTGDDNLSVATEAALALGRIGPAAKGAVPVLYSNLQKKGANAHAIILALGKIGPDAAVAEPLIRKAMASKNGSLAVTASMALTRIHPQSSQVAAEVIPVLVACLSDTLPETRKAAAESLGSIGAKADNVVAALKKTSENDPDKTVRKAAAKALKSVQ